MSTKRKCFSSSPKLSKKEDYRFGFENEGDNKVVRKEEGERYLILMENQLISILKKVLIFVQK